MSNPHSGNRIRFYAALIGVMLCMLIMVAHTSHRIYLHSQQPASAAGILEGVGYQPRSGLEVYAGGELYLLDKESQFSNRTFGIIMNATLGELKSLLESKIGAECHIEYIQLDGLDSHNKRIIDLRIDDLGYVDKDIANEDHIAMEKAMRNIGLAVLTLCIVCIILERKGKIQFEQ